MTGYQRELQEQESIHDLVERALSSLADLDPEYKEEIFLAIDRQHDNYAKVLTYTSFLLESNRLTKDNLRDES